jgi:hypothetical protein
VTIFEALSLGPDVFEEFMEQAQKSLSRRKRRLLAAAVCRTLWHLPAEDASRQAVVAAEAFADRRISAKERRRARRAAAAVCDDLREEVGSPNDPYAALGGLESDDPVDMDAVRWHVARAFEDAAESDSYLAYDDGVDHPWLAAAHAARATPSTNSSAEGAIVGAITGPQAEVLRGEGGGARKTAASQGRPTVHLLQAAVRSDILGHLWYSVGCVDPACLAWHDGAVVKIASAIYADLECPDLSVLATPDCSAMYVLADAVEEAGCANRALLEHLRAPRRHVRGCWVLDLLLGKK